MKTGIGLTLTSIKPGDLCISMYTWCATQCQEIQLQQLNAFSTIYIQVREVQATSVHWVPGCNE